MLRANNNQELWNEVVADYRHACLLRREGQNAEATRIINEKLPKATAAWSREDSRTATEKKAALEAMFSSEQTGIDSWIFAQQALASKVADRLIPALCQGVGEQLHDMIRSQFQALQGRLDRSREVQNSRGPAVLPVSPRIRFDDIPSVIDALLAEQTADYGPAPAFTPKIWDAEPKKQSNPLYRQTASPSPALSAHY